MTRTRTIWTALGVAALGAVAVAVWPVRVVPAASAQAPGFPTTAGTIDRSGLEPGAERTLGLRWRFARVQYLSLIHI